MYLGKRERPSNNGLFDVRNACEKKLRGGAIRDKILKFEFPKGGTFSRSQKWTGGSRKWRIRVFEFEE